MSREAIAAMQAVIEYNKAFPSLPGETVESLRRAVHALSAPAPIEAEAVETMPCPCTTFQQDEDCIEGYPSLLCAACEGKGVAPVDTVVALAAEMMKVAEQVGELEDPFAAWETIDLLKSQAAPAPAARMEAERVERMENALETISNMHGNNPSLAYADVPEADYLRHVLYEARQIARAALEREGRE